jgi:hypothetical protein
MNELCERAGWDSENPNLIIECYEAGSLILQAANIIIVFGSLIFIFFQVRLQTREVANQTAEIIVQTHATQLQSNIHLVSSFETLDSVWQSVRLLRLRNAAAKHLLKMLEEMQNAENGIELRAEHLSTPGYADEYNLIEEPVAQVMEFFERLGAYLEVKAISEKAMWEVFSWYIEYYFNIVESDLSRYREEKGEMYLYENFEKVFRKMKVITKIKLGENEEYYAAITHYKKKFLEEEIEATALLLATLEIETKWK